MVLGGMRDAGGLHMGFVVELGSGGGAELEGCRGMVCMRVVAASDGLLCW